ELFLRRAIPLMELSSSETESLDRLMHAIHLDPHFSLEGPFSRVSDITALFLQSALGHLCYQFQARYSEEECSELARLTFPLIGNEGYGNYVILEAIATIPAEDRRHIVPLVIPLLKGLERVAEYKHIIKAILTISPAEDREQVATLAT